jgi:ATP-binding cassette subfamily B protein
MATAQRHTPGPHGAGASLEELRGWRAFVHLSRELRLARLVRLANPYRRRAVLSVAAMIGVTVSSLAVPYLLKVAIDSGIGKGDLAVLNWVIAAFVAVSTVNLGASYLQTYLTSWVGEHVIYDLRRQLFAHLQKLSLDFFSRQKTGWIVSRLTNDIDALDQLVTDGVTSLVTNSLTFLGAVVFLFILDWRLALATLSIMPFLVAATLVYRSRSARAYAQVRNKIGDVSARLQESLSGMRVIQAFRREQADHDRLALANADYRDVNYRTVAQSGLYFPFVELMSGTAVVIVLWYGGYLVSGRALQIGVLVAFIGYLNSFFDPLQQLSRSTTPFRRPWPPCRRSTRCSTPTLTCWTARRGAAAAGERRRAAAPRHVRL